MAESFRTRWLRWKFNLFPPYRRSGARITYIDATMREVRLCLPLDRRTRNLNGTVYGGAIYAAVDPIHAVMLASLLGAEHYVAWTKEAHIRFRRQARTDLTARFVLEEADVASVREEIEQKGKAERWYPAALHDAEGDICATCDILVHLHPRQREPASRKEPSLAPVPTVH